MDSISAPNSTPSVHPMTLKFSKYEDIWPDEVHAAFMEALSLYPPMGKRRIKYYLLKKGEDKKSVDFHDSSRVKAFGRCQLIQLYILEKTGQSRTRKQVSSHLQRLKKMHRKNPEFLSRLEPKESSLGSSCAEPVPGPEVIGTSGGAKLVALPSSFQSSAASGNKDSEHSRTMHLDVHLPASTNIEHAHNCWKIKNETLDSSYCDAQEPHEAYEGAFLDPHPALQPLVIQNPSIERSYSSMSDKSALHPCNSMSLRRLAAGLPALQRQMELPSPSYQDICDTAEFANTLGSATGLISQPESCFQNSLFSHTTTQYDKDYNDTDYRNNLCSPHPTTKTCYSAPDYGQWSDYSSLPTHALSELKNHIMRWGRYGTFGIPSDAGASSVRGPYDLTYPESGYSSESTSPNTSTEYSWSSDEKLWRLNSGSPDGYDPYGTSVLKPTPIYPESYVHSGADMPLSSCSGAAF
ncbi:TEA-domain-containing protein [Coniophora puteana RWD-64-598 SS2]|uniref:TEA-domain-containing protein n=1 Tax=Coniophora puteana (strain RWD-64-598) TaxID=741705 RepID=A0A5M3N1F8_CONPW|nr:TEA-domain-containing protein [Coniophora puteana RWD-64-598 SS2]EIW85240.1 TEA-domain-containing protein [Coniophora puteana RWD-64-598 SS2]